MRLYSDGLLRDYFVYCLVDPRTNLPFYVGKGRGRRPYQHLKEDGTNYTNRRRYYRIQEIRGKCGRDAIVAKPFQNLTEQTAYVLERALIRKYGRIRYDKGGILTNMTPDGNPPTGSGEKNNNWGKRWSEEKKEALRKKIKGTRTGKDNANYGNRWNQKQKRSLSDKLRSKYGNDTNPNIGKRWDKNHIKQELKRPGKAVRQLTLEGDFIDKFCCVKEASEFCGFSFKAIKECCQGYRESHQDFTWKYED